MFFVYILKSLKNGRYYTGSTSSVERRLLEHQLGQSDATKYLRPFELVWIESYGTRSEAMRREKYFKTGKGREERDRLIKQGMGA
jgi:putative endonuclease